MSKIKLTGENSGYVELSAGQNAGNNTLELPTSGTKVVASDDSGNVNNLGIVTATTFSGNVTGDVTGNLTGNVTGNLTGNVTGDVTSSGTSTFDVISGVSTIGVTTVHLTGINNLSYPTAGPLSNRNLVQNGAMTVNQRSTSESSLTSGNNYILDRWRTYIQDIGTYTISQDSDAPAGFKYSYKIQCTTADASPAAADDMSFYCPYEGQDLQQLKKGTSSAQSVTLSFWVKSNKTSTGQVNFRDQDNNRMISGTYTINSAGTWEYKTITFPGDTSGALDNDNAASISLQWYLDSGSNFSSGSMNSTWGTDSIDKRNVNNFGLASSTSNYWQITGIQLETGSVATPFEHRSYGDELARCQRYFQGWNATSSTERAKTGIFVYDDEGNSSANQSTILGTGSVTDADDARIEFSFPVSMRAKPTTDVADLRLITGSTLHNSSTTVQYNNSTTHNFSALVDNGGGMTTGQCVHLIIKGNGYFYLNAEL